MKVQLEPDLELLAADLDPAAKAALAARLYRWAKQLWLAAALEGASPPPTRRAKLYPRRTRRLTAGRTSASAAASSLSGAPATASPPAGPAAAAPPSTVRNGGAVPVTS